MVTEMQLLFLLTFTLYIFNQSLLPGFILYFITNIIPIKYSKALRWNPKNYGRVNRSERTFREQPIMDEDIF